MLLQKLRKKGKLSKQIISVTTKPKRNTARISAALTLWVSVIEYYTIAFIQELQWLAAVLPHQLHLMGVYEWILKNC
jgi:hypothetical protein